MAQFVKTEAGAWLNVDRVIVAQAIPNPNAVDSFLVEVGIDPTPNDLRSLAQTFGTMQAAEAFIGAGLKTP